jgi:hypothetical protein
VTTPVVPATFINALRAQKFPLYGTPRGRTKLKLQFVGREERFV